ncbi:hypothetical protein GSD1FS_1151 [Bifidobacterium sp. GSD1FS]|uniref:Uncharacterized protein n=1 Tax=Bifidobacterium canis TaxID=2610880 RepID=A0A7K1J571_9BIFI|nr:hypothetical protein [Bifidobacterium canis]
MITVTRRDYSRKRADALVHENASAESNFTAKPVYRSVI